ncbi:heme biosynthesis HemY N-terminal domain-containing protein [Nitrococcus mobilis]|uniref:HemY protein n=1 Tax=Nitrococcus mobilis Nb-231 TaxID=314278 RepID=A4BU05_9GAMM|nr:heme biosynthesis HemY N-terminal domain-containing protein [Nitrococcus mobilis]EAR20826.1 hemY protein [Nitrococcus mobilis Nb-231]
MKRLFLILFVLLFSVVAALWFDEYKGYALFTAGPWTVQMSLFVFAGGFLALWFALNALWSLLRQLWFMPAGVRLWAGNRRRVKARKKLVGGLMLLAEGRNEESEKAVLQGADVVDLPLLSYLVAAFAAQRQGAWDSRDQYLELAAIGDKRAQIGLALLQAQLQMQARQWVQAMAKLDWVRERAPNNHHALRLLAESAEARQDWERLAKLLPDLRKNGVLAAAELEDVETRTAQARLHVAVEQGSEQIEAVWRGLTRDQKRLPGVVALYAQSLIRVGQSEQAEHLLRGGLEKDWDPRLVNVYAELDLNPATRTSEVLERWLKDRPEDPDLLFAAGCQALRSEQLGSARSYLEAASRQVERPMILCLLGDVYERLGESNKARDSYRRALAKALWEEPGRSSVSLLAVPPAKVRSPAEAEAVA